MKTIQTLILVSAVFFVNSAFANTDFHHKHKRAHRHSMSASRTIASHNGASHSGNHRTSRGQRSQARAARPMTPINLGTFPAVVADSTR